ncbi:hypothetical protein [Pontibacter flavimaris]|uniref:Uncharacterized protein n=1 Tax=Pontibacter flavimaris TaxID=1797110 RepID=A0A1Q5PDL6_9BACT|nr:hypothetical protein [Pontibacter flavimaris]OKL40314.1 hypothetical protein A3841_18500 [Pontibacter flavimaris]
MTSIRGSIVLVTGGASGILPARLFDRPVGCGFNVYPSMDQFIGWPAAGAAPDKSLASKV